MILQDMFYSDRLVDKETDHGDYVCMPSAAVRRGWVRADTKCRHPFYTARRLLDPDDGLFECQINKFGVPVRSGYELTALAIAKWSTENHTNAWASPPAIAQFGGIVVQYGISQDTLDRRYHEAAALR